LGRQVDDRRITPYSHVEYIANVSSKLNNTQQRFNKDKANRMTTLQQSSILTQQLLFFHKTTYFLLSTLSSKKTRDELFNKLPEPSLIQWFIDGVDLQTATEYGSLMVLKRPLEIAMAIASSNGVRLNDRDFALLQLFRIVADDAVPRQSIKELFKVAFPRTKPVPTNPEKLRQFFLQTKFPDKLFEALHSLRAIDKTKCCREHANCGCTRVVTDAKIDELFGGFTAWVIQEIESEEEKKGVERQNRFGRFVEPNQYNNFKVVLDIMKSIWHYGVKSKERSTVIQNYASIIPSNCSSGNREQLLFETSPLTKEQLERLHSYYTVKIWPTMSDETRAQRDGSQTYTGYFKPIVSELRNKMVYEDPGNDWFETLTATNDEKEGSFYDLIMTLGVHLIVSAKDKFPEAYGVVSSSPEVDTTQLREFDLDKVIGEFNYKKERNQ